MIAVASAMAILHANQAAAAPFIILQHIRSVLSLLHTAAGTAVGNQRNRSRGCLEQRAVVLRLMCSGNAMRR